MASSSSEPAPDPSLNMQHAGQKLWLMKVPSFLLKNWTEREHGSPVELGRVEEKVGPDGKKTMSLRLSEKESYPEEWPREYELGVDAPPSAMSMYVFSSGTKGPMQFDGRVEKRGEVKPLMTKQYRDLMKSRNANAGLRAGIMSYNPHATDQEAAQLRGLAPLTTQDKGKKRLKEAKKAEREDKKDDKRKRQKTQEELRDLVFDSFQKQKFWNRHELEKALEQQGLNSLKKVLDQVAERVNAGPHKGEYQLRSEFRQ